MSKYEGEHPAKKAREDTNGKSQKSIDLDFSVRQLLDTFYPPSCPNESKSKVLNSSLKQDLQKKEMIRMWTQKW